MKFRDNLGIKKTEAYRLRHRKAKAAFAMRPFFEDVRAMTRRVEIAPMPKPKPVGEIAIYSRRVFEESADDEKFSAFENAIACIVLIMFAPIIAIAIAEKFYDWLC